MMRLGSILRRIASEAFTERDIAGLAALRVLYGLIMAWSAARFMLYGWVEQFFFKPTFFFKYWGFDWVSRPPEPILYGMFVAMTVAGVMVAAGMFTRVALLGGVALFTYIELIDVTNYLNHYYLVTLLGLLLSVMPVGRAYSVDAWRRASMARRVVPAWMVWLVRLQVATVYFWAGMAKLGPDWLNGANPLHIWMRARVDAPLVGNLLDEWWVALAMSWGGFVFDSTIWIFLLWKPTRKWAYAVVVVFHLVTGYLFNIGLFPLIMICAATIFFDPSWPRALIERMRGGATSARTPQLAQATACTPTWRRRLILGGCILWGTIQWMVPARHLMYEGDVLWNEQGMRWAWKVMVREKNGSITYRVRHAERQRYTEVAPTQFLTDHQAREFAGQPDMILQLGHHIGRHFEKKGHEDVEVYVDALVSLNGRPPRPMIDPTVDLMTIEDGIGPAPWILDGPDAPLPKTLWTNTD